MGKLIIKNLILFTVIILLGCTGSLNEKSEFQFNEISVSYDTETAELEITTTIENISLINAIDSVWAELYNCEGLVISLELESAYNEIMSQTPYEIKDTILELPYDVYIVKFSMQDALGNLFSEFSEPKELNPISPSQESTIIGYKICNTYDDTCIDNDTCLFACSEISANEVVLDEYEWTKIIFLIHVSDSNGISDISHIKYQLKGDLEGCTEDTNGDGEISGTQTWLDYYDGGTAGHEWKFIEGNYYIETCEASYIYIGWMRLRPRDGSALYDEDEEVIEGYEADDCGKVGTVYLKFIVTDNSDEPTVIDEIRLDIIAP